MKRCITMVLADFQLYKWFFDWFFDWTKYIAPLWLHSDNSSPLSSLTTTSFPTTTPFWTTQSHSDKQLLSDIFISNKLFKKITIMRDIYYIIYIIGTKKLKISRVKKIRFLFAYVLSFPSWRIFWTNTPQNWINIVNIELF